MLSVVEISNRIKNPNLVAPSDLSTLQELSGKYPYAQLFSILYLKSLSKAGDPRFEEELRRHSFRISDRVQLYELIQDHEENQSVSASEKSELIETAPIVEEKPVESVIELTEEIEVVLEEKVEAHIEAATIDIIQEEIITKTSVLEENFKENQEPQPIEEIEVPIKTTTKENITEEIETEAPVLGEKTEEYQEPQPIEEEEEEIAQESDTDQKIDSDFTEEKIEIQKIEIEPKDKLEESILHHAFAANYRLDDLTAEEIENLELKEVKKEDIPTTEVEEKANLKISSFTAWLKSNNNYSEADSADKKAINAVVEDFSDFDPSSELLFGEVEKKKTEFYSPAKKARKSLEENELPVSETLAKIYVMQGNYPQAISAYKQLSLSFPEKNIFFAHLIEDLEKKINK